jgi:hypothetical protein
MQTYDANGIRFLFPDGWQFQESRDGTQLTLTILSSETSFWSATIFDEMQDGQHVIDQVLDALRQEYGQLDVYEVTTRICELPNLSYDAEFICYELVNSAFLRFVDSDSRPVLIYYQGTDQELEKSRPVLEAITESLRITDSAAGFPR